MNTKLFVALCLAAVICALASVTQAQNTCYSGYIVNYQTNYTSGSYICPIGYLSILDGTTRKCSSVKDVKTSVLGKACTFNSDCLLSSLTCDSNLCVEKSTRIEGDACSKTSMCQSTYKFNAMNCYQSKCSQYTKVTKKPGETCGTSDSALNTVDVCDSSSVCTYSSLTLKCYTKKTVALAGVCGIPDTTANTIGVCDTGNTCVLGVCIVTPVVTLIKEGADCSALTSICDVGLVCRKKTAAAATVTCEKRAQWTEYCTTTSDCLTNVGGMVSCVKSACTRTASVLIDGACDNHADCFSGYCANSKCATGTADKCYSGNSCPGSLSCGCNGEPYQVGQGNCMPLCNGWATEAAVCLWNSGVDAPAAFISQIGAMQVVDDLSAAYKTCATQIQSLYACYKSSLNSGGLSFTATKDTLGSSLVDLSVALPTIPTKATLPEVRSGAMNVMFSGVSMVVMMLIAFFAL